MRTKEYKKLLIYFISVKRKSLFLVMVIFIFFCSEFIQNVHGNPVAAPITENPFFRVIILISMFFIGTGVEYAYFNHKIYGFEYDSKSLFRLIIRINLVTYPLTQILSYFFYIYFSLFFWVYVLLIEIGVVFIESQLLVKSQNSVFVGISSFVITRDTFIANFFSFLVGLIGFLPIEVFIMIFIPYY